MSAYRPLEGGVGWAVNLYNLFFEHWEKRNVDAMRKNLDPALVDRDLVVKLFEQHGDDVHKEQIEKCGWETDTFLRSGTRSKTISMSFAIRAFVLKVTYRIFLSIGSILAARRMTGRFPPHSIAGLNRKGARLKAILSSDIGHWDVIDATTCLAESVELVEDGLMSADDLRDFAFYNAGELHGMMNPDFFKGTVIEAEATAALATASETVAAE